MNSIIYYQDYARSLLGILRLRKHLTSTTIKHNISFETLCIYFISMSNISLGKEKFESNFININSNLN